jgi:type II secretory pathway pseudopilin PulG
MNHSRKYFPGITSERGVTLLLVIIAMVIMAILGVGLFALYSTSSFNQVEAQKTAKAYYLAESGIRVVASEFHSSANRNATLVNLQGKTFNLPDNSGSFTLQIYPYWFKPSISSSAGATPIILYLPGKLPPVNSGSSTSIPNIPAPGILKLRDNTNNNYTKVGVFTASSPGSYDTNNGTPITFTITGGFPYSISLGNELSLGYVYANPPPSIIMGGDLVFTDPDHTAEMYPPKNGSITIYMIFGGQYAVGHYTYERRIPQTIDHGSPPASFTLHNVQGGPFPIKFTYDSANPYDVKKTTQIYLGETLGIQSTSTVGN